MVSKRCLNMWSELKCPTILIFFKPPLELPGFPLERGWKVMVVKKP